MELTPNERFPYPDGNDPGNGALDLQILAEAIDAKATAMLASFKSVLNGPVRVVRLGATGPFPVLDGSFNEVFGMGAGQWVSQYDSTSVFSLDAAQMAGFGSAPGVFRLGCYLATNPTGAITASSFRELRISATVPVNDPTIFPLNTTVKRSLSQVYEAGVGFVGQTCELEFATLFPPVTTCNIEFRHSNAASTVAALTGTLTYMYRVANIEVL